MRVLAAGLLVATALLAGCKREPSFDERYAGAKKAIGEKVGELDKDMARRAAEDRTRGPVPAAPPPPPPTPGAI